MGTLDTKTAYEKANTIDNTFSNSDTYPKTVITAPAGKRIVVHDLILGVANIATNQYVIIVVQAQIGGSWVNIMPVGAGPNSAQTVDHDFRGRIQTDIGGAVRLFKSGTSTSFQGVLAGTGFIE